MGEKRAYNARKPGGGRKKLKPEYDAGENLKEQMDAAAALYEEDCSLQSIADALALNPIKVRKLLITAGVYESEVAEKVQDTFEKYRETQSYKEAILSTANTLQLSKASVTSDQSRQRSTCGRRSCFIVVCNLKPIPAYPLPMKYERAEAANIQRNCGSTAEGRAKAWRGVLCCWHWGISKR